MANWNPSATGTLGQQWFPVLTGVTNLDDSSKTIATAFDQSASVAIPSVNVVNVGIAVRGGIYAVEVFDNETAVSDANYTFQDAVPSADVNDGAWLNQAGNNVNMFQSIDEGFAAASFSDYIRLTGTSSTVTMRLNTTSLTLTGKRIVGVKLGVYAILSSTAVMLRGLAIGGVNYLGNSGQIAGPRTAAWYYTTWYYNPATKKPWTIADVNNFASSDAFFIQASSSPGWTACDVGAVTMTVIYVTENRLAVGTLDDSGSGLAVGTPSAPKWNGVSLLTPTGASWTKDGTGRHLYTVRRMTGTGQSGVGSISIPYLDTDPNTGLVAPIGRSWDMKIDKNYGYAQAMLGSTTRMYPFVQVTTGPAVHTDSQPYGMPNVGVVYTGTIARSEFTGAAATYGVIRFYVNHASLGTAGLDIKIKRNSDNVQLGGTYTLTPTAYRTFPVTGSAYGTGYEGWRLVQIQIPTPATLAAVQNYVEFSSTAASTAPWAIYGIKNPENNGVEGTYNSSTDAATINGLAQDDGTDMLVTISTVPTAPAALVANLGMQTVGETVACETAIERADLTWTATALGGSFLRYEIQRSEDGAVTWQDVATVTVESVVAWKDYEGQRGVTASYRIRVVRTDNAFSPWTQSGTLTKPTVATGYLNLGSQNSYVRAPDSVGLSVTRDIEIRARVALDDWSQSDNLVIAAKMETGTVSSWYFGYSSGGFLTFGWTATGATGANVNTLSTASAGALGIPSGGARWLRVTREYLSGNVKFWFAPDQPTEPTGSQWIQLGATVVSTPGGLIFDGTDEVSIGGYFGDSNTAGMNGKVYQLIIYNGIGPTSYVLCDGVSNQIATADSFTNSILGDIDISVRVALDDWTPATYQALASKRSLTTNGWSLYVNQTDGRFTFRWGQPADTIAGSGVSTGFADGSAHWIRVTRKWTSGVVTFYVAPDQVEEPTTWTLFDTVGGTTGGLTDAGPLWFAQDNVFSLPMNGKFYRGIVRDGIGVEGRVVADFDARKADGAKTGTLYTDAYGNVWTLTGTGGGAVAVRGFKAADPNFANPEGHNAYYPNGLSDSSGNIWTVTGIAPQQWVSAAQGNASMHLVSNYNPTQNLAYEYRPSKDYTFNEADEQQLQGTFGRDFQLAANPIENRGVTASWTFLVGVDDKVPSGGGNSWNAYTPLRNLARAAIPYVCMLDHRGNRMYAALRVPGGNEDSAGGADIYLADVSASEIAGVPYVVTVSS